MRRKSDKNGNGSSACAIPRTFLGHGLEAIWSHNEIGTNADGSWRRFRAELRLDERTVGYLDIYGHQYRIEASGLSMVQMNMIRRALRKLDCTEIKG